MIRAVERVKERLARATATLDAAGVPCAVAGGNAVAAWVARVDPAGVRNTVEVNLWIRRSDFDAASECRRNSRRGCSNCSTLRMAKARNGLSYLIPCIHFLIMGDKTKSSTPEPSATNPT
jgi:hypothetical protein